MNRRFQRTSRAINRLLLGLLLGACNMTATPTELRMVTAFVGGRVQTAPEAEAIADGVVLVENGRVTAVGPRAQVPHAEGGALLSAHPRRPHDGAGEPLRSVRADGSARGRIRRGYRPGRGRPCPGHPRARPRARHVARRPRDLPDGAVILEVTRQLGTPWDMG